MAVNKNFVVKNGLEVDTNTLFVDSANNRVAIGTTVPTATLDVRGKILTNSQVESFVGKFVGMDSWYSDTAIQRPTGNKIHAIF